MNSTDKNPIRFIAIVAMDEKRVIGNKNALPWNIPEDMRHFSKLTKGHSVLMGRKTYESLPEKYRPLPERLNMVITRDPSKLKVPPGVLVFRSPSECIEACRQGDVALRSEIVWIIGGSEIYQETMDEWDEVYITRVEGTHEGDAFLPEFESSFELVEREIHQGFVFERCKRQAD